MWAGTSRSERALPRSIRLDPPDDPLGKKCATMYRFDRRPRHDLELDPNRWFGHEES
jgi:hypothetical protein